MHTALLHALHERLLSVAPSLSDTGIVSLLHTCCAAGQAAIIDNSTSNNNSNTLSSSSSDEAHERKSSSSTTTVSTSTKSGQEHALELEQAHRVLLALVQRVRRQKRLRLAFSQMPLQQQYKQQQQQTTQQKHQQQQQQHPTHHHSARPHSLASLPIVDLCALMSGLEVLLAHAPCVTRSSSVPTDQHATVNASDAQHADRNSDAEATTTAGQPSLSACVHSSVPGAAHERADASSEVEAADTSQVLNGAQLLLTEVLIPGTQAAVDDMGRVSGIGCVMCV